jgi:hypothetical protein
MVCLTMGKYHDSSVSQWEIRMKHWNIGPMISVDSFPYELLIQL